jgi:galactonate dehydratase
MKVTNVEIFDIYFEEAKIIQPYWHPIIMRVHTDEGISGLGEVGLAYGTGHSAAVGMAKNMVENFLIGADPLKVEKIWDTIFRTSFWAQGGGPVVYGGMSAIDIACWDIKGKALGQPIYQLLGGKTNDELRTYASQIQFGWDKQIKACAKPEDYAEVAQKAVSEGYDCVKVDPIVFDEKGERGWNLKKLLSNKQITLFYNRVKAIREAVGADVDIIIELHSFLNASSAIQLGRVLEEFDCFYYEEPTNYMNVELQSKIAQSVAIPMAAGERLYTRWGYRQYFEKQAIDVIQPDLCLVGGISEGKKICDYAAVYDITVQVHCCGSPITTAAALQLEAVIPNFQIHEHHTYAIKPGNREICVQDYQPEKGKYYTPDLPGLGLELNEAVVSKSPCIRIP